MSDEYVDEIYLEELHETAKAIKFTDGTNEFWIPKSQIKQITYISGNDYKLTLPEFIAKEKGLI